MSLLNVSILKRRLVVLSAAKDLIVQTCTSSISIRLPKAVIETYKMLAGMYGLGYQPLMRDALCRFAEGEMKQLLLGAVETQRRQKKVPEPAKADGSTSAAGKKLKAAA